MTVKNISKIIVTLLVSFSVSQVLAMEKFYTLNRFDKQSKDSGTTAFHWAAIDNNLELVQSFLEHGAQINEKDGRGWTALHYAIENQHLRIVQLLVTKGAKINEKADDGSTPLHNAAYERNLDIARFLITNGADVNEKANDGSTPLHHAVQAHALEIARFLVNNGAKVNAKMNDGTTALYLATKHGFDPRMARLLVENGADVYEQNNDGKTVLDAIDYGKEVHGVKSFAAIAEYLAARMAPRQILYALLALEDLVPEKERTIDIPAIPGGPIIRSFPPEDIDRILRPIILAAPTKQ